MSRFAVWIAIAALGAACPGKTPVDAGSGGGTAGGGTGGGTAGGSGGGGGGGGGNAGGGTGGGANDSGTDDAGVDGGPVDAGVDAGVVHLSLALHRGDAGTPTPILAEVTAVDDFGQPVSGLDIVIDAQNFSSPTTEVAGRYRATIMPAILSGEIPLVARLASADAGVSRTALVVPTIADYWDQPEMLPGLVDTAGTEDSSTVSADGQWLILGTYSPVDLLCCFTGCGGWAALDAQSPWCNTPLGPVSGPARPNMPGAERVSASGIDDAVPLMCATGLDGGPVEVPSPDGGIHPFALPPVGIYMFHRQADGTFAEPRVIDTGSDGFLSQPFCFTFLGTGDAGTQVPVLFGYNIDSPDGGKPHPWYAQLTLGEDNSLYSYSCAPQATAPTFAPKAITALPVGPVGQQAGNTTVAEVNSTFYLLSDDESATPPFVEFSVGLADGGYTDWAPMALPDPTADRRQPMFVGGRLFYYRSGDVVSTGWNGNDPSDPNSFTAANVELGHGMPNGTLGELVAIGQPTFAAPPDAGIEMYFVYYRRTATGLDGQIGRVPLR